MPEETAWNELAWSHDDGFHWTKTHREHPEDGGKTACGLEIPNGSTQFECFDIAGEGYCRRCEAAYMREE